MKILFLTPRIPWPPKSGGTLKSWEMVKYLCGTHDVVFASFVRSDDSPEAKQISDQVGLQKTILVPLEKPRNIWQWMASCLHGKPLSIYRNWSPEMSASLEEGMASADRIVVDHFLMYQYVPLQYDHKTVLHEHNAEYLMWQRYAEQSGHLLKRMLVGLEGKRVLRYEQRICQRAHKVLAAPNDIEMLQKLAVAPEKFSVTYHLGEQSALRKPDIPFAQTQCRLLYVGSLRWEPNVDGLLWFLDLVWPILKREEPRLEFVIVGGDPDSRLVRRVEALPDVSLPGFVEDVEPLFGSSRVFVSPLRFGSGIKVKVVNALYRGLPTVTTSVGVEGLALENGRHAFWTENPENMAIMIKQLLNDSALWTLQRDSARALMRKQYTWDVVFANLEEALHA